MKTEKKTEIEDYYTTSRSFSGPHGPMEKYLPNFVEGYYMIRRAFYPHPTKDKQSQFLENIKNLL